MQPVLTIIIEATDELEAVSIEKAERNVKRSAAMKEQIYDDEDRVKSSRPNSQLIFI